MEHKPTGAFTDQEKEMMDTIAVNYILAQSDGFQLGYAQALSDLTAEIVDGWNGTDDRPQQSILDALVYLGVELRTRKEVAEKNINKALERGYEKYYCWEYRDETEPFSRNVLLFTKKPQSESEGEGR